MDPIRLVEFLESAAAWIAIAQLVRLKLAKRFYGLFAWLCLMALSHLAGAFVSHTSQTYFWIYIFFVPAECILGIVAVRELFALVFANYPGIRTVGRYSMYGGILLATLMSFLVANVFRRTSTHGSRHLFYLEVSQRSIIFSLVVVIATILFFLSRYPLHLGRNTYVSSAFFSALFLSEAARLLIDSLETELYSVVVDWTQGLFVLFCLLTWAFMLREETAPKPAVVSFASPAENDLLEQLASLNQLLGRTVRR